MGQSASLVRWLRLRRCLFEEGVFKHFFLYFAAVGDVRVGTDAVGDGGRNRDSVSAAHAPTEKVGAPAAGTLPEGLSSAVAPIIVPDGRAQASVLVWAPWRQSQTRQHQWLMVRLLGAPAGGLSGAAPSVPVVPTTDTATVQAVGLGNISLSKDLPCIPMQVMTCRISL